MRKSGEEGESLRRELVGIGGYCDGDGGEKTVAAAAKENRRREAVDSRKRTSNEGI